jgi:hypothetical protein
MASPAHLAEALAATTRTDKRKRSPDMPHTHSSNAETTQGASPSLSIAQSLFPNSEPADLIASVKKLLACLPTYFAPAPAAARSERESQPRPGPL